MFVELAETTTDGVTGAVMVIAMALEVSVVGLAHCAFDSSIHLKTSPLLTDDAVYVEEVVPEIATPFFCHVYTGALPPLVILVVNVTDPVEQIEVALGVIAMDGVTFCITDTDKTLDVSLDVDAHDSDDVSTQVIFTVLPKFKELITSVADVAPEIGTLLRNHW
jgi:hypothetical protein